MKGAYAPHEILRSQAAVQSDVLSGSADAHRDVTGLSRNRTRGNASGDDGRTNYERAGLEAVLRNNRAGKSSSSHFNTSHASLVYQSACRQSGLSDKPVNPDERLYSTKKEGLQALLLVTPQSL